MHSYVKTKFAWALPLSRISALWRDLIFTLVLMTGTETTWVFINIYYHLDLHLLWVLIFIVLHIHAMISIHTAWSTVMEVIGKLFLDSQGLELECTNWYENQAQTLCKSSKCSWSLRLLSTHIHQSFEK